MTVTRTAHLPPGSRGWMYADHRRPIAAPESCCNNTINLHQKKMQWAGSTTDLAKAGQGIKAHRSTVNLHARLDSHWYFLQIYDKCFTIMEILMIVNKDFQISAVHACKARPRKSFEKLVSSVFRAIHRLFQATFQNLRLVGTDICLAAMRCGCGFEGLRQRAGHQL